MLLIRKYIWVTSLKFGHWQFPVGLNFRCLQYELNLTMPQANAINQSYNTHSIHKCTSKNSEIVLFLLTYQKSDRKTSFPVVFALPLAQAHTNHVIFTPLAYTTAIAKLTAVFQTFYFSHINRKKLPKPTYFSKKLNSILQVHNIIKFRQNSATW